MWKAPLAVLAVSAAVSVPYALAAEGDSTTTSTTTPSESICNRASDHRVLHERLALKRWKVAKPLRGTNLCVGKNHVAKELTQFRRWQTYRNIAPYAGCSSGGKWLRFTAIPGSVVYRESTCSWTAQNDSGACGPYQLLGWTSCDTSSWQDKMRHHRMAAYVLRVQGPGAWVAW